MSFYLYLSPLSSSSPCFYLKSNLEAKQGVSGYLDMQDNLEKVSSMKSTVDERKGRTLEDISQMVAQLTKLIESKKTELSPAIRELRAVRAQAQEVEV